MTDGHSSTGEPDAGNRPVRFGGRGGPTGPSLPLCASVKQTILTGESPSPTGAYRRVAERNRVIARWGGEQQEANDSSQSSIPMRLNSIRLFRVTSLRRKGEVLGERSMSKGGSQYVKTLRNAGSAWSGKERKASWLSREICPGAKGSWAEVRASIVAMKRVTTVEPREAGR